MQLLIGDCVDVMQEMPDDSVDSVVTDPPYGLAFMGKAWDRSVPAVEVWREALRVLKPGGHILCFAGTRTYHRMACAIEDAGFEIRDQIGWVYGSGFPKSRNVGREVAAFDGWGTSLKPAWEPICVARKPLTGTVAANVLEHGTGALNIDGCRVDYADAADMAGAYAKVGGRTESQSLHGDTGMNVPGKTTGRDYVQPQGRWPANLIHDGSDEVTRLFPVTTSGSMKAGTRRAAQDEPGSVCYGTYGGNATTTDTYADTGSAARFFYCAKASKADRGEGNTHPTVKPTDLMRYLCRLVTPPGGVVLDPFMGSGSTGKAAKAEGFDFIGIDLDPHSVAIAHCRIGIMPGVTV